MIHTVCLEKEIRNKYQIIIHLLVPLKSLTRYPNRDAVISNADTSRGLKTLPQINQTGNHLKKEKMIDLKEIITKR